MTEITKSWIDEIDNYEKFLDELIAVNNESINTIKLDDFVDILKNEINDDKNN